MCQTVVFYVYSTFFGLIMRFLSLMCFCFFFQAEDGIRDLVRSRGLGDVYKRQFVISLLLWVNWSDGEAAMQFVEKVAWLPAANLFLSLIHI